MAQHHRRLRKQKDVIGDLRHYEYKKSAIELIVALSEATTTKARAIRSRDNGKGLLNSYWALMKTSRWISPILQTASFRAHARRMAARHRLN